MARNLPQGHLFLSGQRVIRPTDKNDVLLLFVMLLPFGEVERTVDDINDIQRVFLHLLDQCRQFPGANLHGGVASQAAEILHDVGQKK